MTSDVLPDPASAFGKRVQERLRSERIVWFTSVGRDGTPQPNPVWFIWTGTDEVHVYTVPNAHRLAHIDQRPHVSLHFNSTRTGSEAVVLRGLAERDDDVPAANTSSEYLEKYRDDMARVSGSVDAFSATYSVPIRVRLTRIRGF